MSSTHELFKKVQNEREKSRKAVNDENADGVVSSRGKATSRAKSREGANSNGYSMPFATKALIAILTVAILALWGAGVRLYAMINENESRIDAFNSDKDVLDKDGSNVILENLYRSVSRQEKKLEKLGERMDEQALFMKLLDNSKNTLQRTLRALEMDLKDIRLDITRITVHEPQATIASSGERLAISE
ncbi:MAG: hypothetical protein ABID09_05340 [Candidatus Omnitrophota bacterium]